MPKEVSLDSPFEQIYKHRYEFPDVYVRLAKTVGAPLSNEWEKRSMSQLGHQLIEHRWDIQPSEHICPQCGTTFMSRNPNAMYDKPYCRFKASRERRALQREI